MAILGIDEVGRGPLAGPLVVGAAILPEPSLWPAWVEELKDSKKLTAKKRAKLSALIWEEAPAAGLGWVPARELDEVGVSAALRLATRRAVEAVQASRVPFQQIIIDGKVNFLKDTALGQYVSTMPKADNLIKEVSAASIIAKVARDNYMAKIATDYPEYGFAGHVGYGTAAHLQALREFGPCPEHRRSYEPCKSLWPADDGAPAHSTAPASSTTYSIPKHTSPTLCDKPNTTTIGRTAEQKVADYLQTLGHTIIAQNFKTKYCEIDIISTEPATNKIFFTEVKYRKTSARGGGLAAIDKQKRQQMQFAAEVFLKSHKTFRTHDPLLAAASVTGEDYEIADLLTLTAFD